MLFDVCEVGVGMDWVINYFVGVDVFLCGVSKFLEFDEYGEEILCEFGYL